MRITPLKAGVLGAAGVLFASFVLAVFFGDQLFGDGAPGWVEWVGVVLRLVVAVSLIMFFREVRNQSKHRVMAPAKTSALAAVGLLFTSLALAVFDGALEWMWWVEIVLCLVLAVSLITVAREWGSSRGVEATQSGPGQDTIGV